MTYYDRIAKQWHQATGHKGGAFKELVLNDVLLKKLPTIESSSILELGAGNGYFLRLLLRHFSGQNAGAGHGERGIAFAFQDGQDDGIAFYKDFGRAVLGE